MIYELIQEIQNETGGEYMSTVALDKIGELVERVRDLQFQLLPFPELVVVDLSFKALMGLCETISPGLLNAATAYQLAQCANILAFCVLRTAAKEVRCPFNAEDREKYKNILDRLQEPFGHTPAFDLERETFFWQLDYTKNSLEALSLFAHSNNREFIRFLKKFPVEIPEDSTQLPSVSARTLLGSLGSVYSEQREKNFSEAFYHAYWLMGMLPFAVAGQRIQDNSYLQTLLDYKKDTTKIPVFCFRLYILSELAEALSEGEALNQVVQAFQDDTRRLRDIRHSRRLFSFGTQSRDLQYRNILILTLQKLYQVRPEVIQPMLDDLGILPIRMDLLTSLRQLHPFIQEGLRKREPVRGKEVIVVLGNKGAGKSLTITGMMGGEMERTDEIDPLTDERVIRVKPSHQRFPKIGRDDSTDAQTTFPEGWLGKRDVQIGYLDCPGFEHTRSEEKFGISLLQQSTLETDFCCTKGILILINVNDLKSTRSAPFLKLMTTLKSLFKNDKLGKGSIVERHCIFALTHLPGDGFVNDDDYQSKMLKLKGRFEKTYQQAMTRVACEYRESERHEDESVLVSSWFSRVRKNVSQSVSSLLTSEEDKRELEAQASVLEMLLNVWDGGRVVALYLCDGGVSWQRLSVQINAIRSGEETLNDTFNFEKCDSEIRSRLMTPLVKQSSEMNGKLCNEKEYLENQQRLLGDEFKSIESVENAIQANKNALSQQLIERENQERLFEKTRNELNKLIEQGQGKINRNQIDHQELSEEIEKLKTEEISLNRELTLEEKRVLENERREYEQKEQEYQSIWQGKKNCEADMAERQRNLRMIEQWLGNYAAEQRQIELTLRLAQDQKKQYEADSARHKRLFQFIQLKKKALERINIRETASLPCWSVECDGGWGNQLTRFDYASRKIETKPSAQRGEWEVVSETPFGNGNLPWPVAKIILKKTPVAYKQIALGIEAGAAAYLMVSVAGGFGLPVLPALGSVVVHGVRYLYQEQLTEVIFPGNNQALTLEWNQPITFTLPESEFHSRELGFKKEERILVNASFSCVYTAPCWIWDKQNLVLEIYTTVCYQDGNPQKIQFLKEKLAEYKTERDGLGVRLKRGEGIHRKIEMLQKKIKERTDEHERKMTEKAALKACFTVLQNNWDQFNEQAKLLKKERDDLNDRCQQLSKELDERAASVRQRKVQLAAQLNNKTEELLNVEAELDDLNKRIIQLKEEMKQLYKSHIMAQSLSDELREGLCIKIENLKDKLYKLKAVETKRQNLGTEIETNRELIQLICAVFDPLKIPVAQHIQDLMEYWAERESRTAYCQDQTVEVIEEAVEVSDFSEGGLSQARLISGLGLLAAPMQHAGEDEARNNEQAKQAEGQLEVKSTIM